MSILYFVSIRVYFSRVYFRVYFACLFFVCACLFVSILRVYSCLFFASVSMHTCSGVCAAFDNYRAYACEFRSLNEADTERREKSRIQTKCVR